MNEGGASVVVSGKTLYVVGITTGALSGPNRGDEDAFIAKLSTE